MGALRIGWLLFGTIRGMLLSGICAEFIPGSVPSIRAAQAELAFLFSTGFGAATGITCGVLAGKRFANRGPVVFRTTVAATLALLAIFVCIWVALTVAFGL